MQNDVESRIPLFSTSGSLHDWLAANQQPKFRAQQIGQWLYQNRATGFDSMTNLPLAIRQQLAESFDFWTTEIAKHLKSNDGTEKLLVKLDDNSHVECVLLRDGHRRTICVSSQVGCAMGCVFCASGLDGVKRNLDSHEIVEQMIRLQHCLEPQQRLSHIVMMGMGEPLANVDNVLAALDVATAADGLGISPRRVTISTVGLPAAIEKLAGYGKPYNLAVSLHAPNDLLRNQLVPVNDKIGIQAIIDAADRYFEISGRRLTFEYVLLGGVNDSTDCAMELSELLRNKSALINVIPYNPVPGLPWVSPSEKSIANFGDILRRNKINVKFRVRKGSDIAAACGQLRRQQVTEISASQSIGQTQ